MQGPLHDLDADLQKVDASGDAESVLHKVLSKCQIEFHATCKRPSMEEKENTECDVLQ